MRKAILLVSAIVMIAVISSCKKTNTNNTYTCSCNFIYIKGTYTGDTIEHTTYPAGTSKVDAQTSCTYSQDTLKSTGYPSASCLLSAQ